MIRSLTELKFYLQADMMMNRGMFKKDVKSCLKELIAPDYIMKYLRCLRKTEYAQNCVGEV